MLITKLFERQSNDFDYINYKLRIEHHFHFRNLLNVPRPKFKKMFEIRQEQHYLRYRFELLKHWIRENEFYSEGYINHLDKLIHKMFLTNELNAYEQEYIKHYHGVVFAKTRNLKSLIVDFPLQKNEIPYYKYENTSFYRLVNNKMIPIERNGELFITTRKILLSHDLNVFPIEFENIINYKVSRYGLLITTANNTYVFKAYDDYLPYVSLERVFRLEKINL
jgi:hypothetical protein